MRVSERRLGRRKGRERLVTNALGILAPLDANPPPDLEDEQQRHCSCRSMLKVLERACNRVIHKGTDVVQAAKKRKSKSVT